jgi:hypothetical protein
MNIRERILKNKKFGFIKYLDQYLIHDPMYNMNKRGLKNE